MFDGIIKAKLVCFVEAAEVEKQGRCASFIEII